jgi:hypothetical protein
MQWEWRQGQGLRRRECFARKLDWEKEQKLSDPGNAGKSQLGSLVHSMLLVEEKQKDTCNQVF